MGGGEGADTQGEPRLPDRISGVQTPGNLLECPSQEAPFPKKAMSQGFLGREEGSKGTEKGTDWPEVTQPSGAALWPPGPCLPGQLSPAETCGASWRSRLGRAAG